MDNKKRTHYFTWIYQTVDIEEGNDFDVKMYHQQTKKQALLDFKYFYKKYKDYKNTLIIGFKITTNLSLDDLDIAHSDLEKLNGYEQLYYFEQKEY